MHTRKPDPTERNRLLDVEETHFADAKSRKIKPAKLQQTFVAFANADGGDLYIGVEDKKVTEERMSGFSTIEDANDMIATLLEETDPAVENVDLEFIDFADDGFVLHLTVPKSPKVHYTAQGDCYIRVNAATRKIKGDRITQLAYAKGIHSFERQPLPDVDLEEITESVALLHYIKRIGSHLDPERFLRKQRLLTKVDETRVPTAGAVLMFDDEPQSALATRCSVKIYRLLTTESEYKREQLEGPPTTISGPLESQIHTTLKLIGNMLSGVTYEVRGQFEKLFYPTNALHEIIVNAIIHRDYSLNDDIHIRVYDNRIEVISPGRLPGYITPDNIYDERFSRNPTIVRLLNQLPDPVNHDIGEGLDTARNELRRAGLVPPTITEQDNAVKITIKHQRVASLVDVILNYLNEVEGREITNKTVRELSGEDDVNKVKKALQKLRAEGKIEPVDPNVAAFDFRYRRVTTNDR